jgi:hypothetical protein
MPPKDAAALRAVRSRLPTSRAELIADRQMAEAAAFLFLVYMRFALQLAFELVVVFLEQRSEARRNEIIITYAVFCLTPSSR